MHDEEDLRRRRDMQNLCFKKRWKKLNDRQHRCSNLRCQLHHPHNASSERPGPPGIAKPRMHRTRPDRHQ